MDRGSLRNLRKLAIAVETAHAADPKSDGFFWRRCRPPYEQSCKILCSMRPFLGIAFVGLLARSSCLLLYDCASWSSIPLGPIPYTPIRASHFVLVKPFLLVFLFVELLQMTPRIRVFRLSLSPSIPCSPIPYTPSMQPISSWSGRCIRIAFCGAAYCDSSYPSVLD